MLTRASLAALALLALAPAAVAQGVQGNIVAGPAGGTALAIAGELAAVGAECGQDLAARESAGAVENLLAVRDRRVTQLGVVQGDVLEYFRTFEEDDPAIRRASQGIRVAFPLYGEEVHVLARREIGALAELDGRRVAVGAEGSGTRLTAELVLDLAEVEPAEALPLAPAEALTELRAGEIDALFVVDGAPVALLAEADIDPEVFHLLPLTEPVLAAAYTPARIAAGTYPFAVEPVEVVTVPAVLITYGFDPRRNAYHAASCRLVAEVSHLLVSRLERLRAEGHPKWREVDPTALPRGWQVSDCVLDGLAPGFAFQCRRPDGSVVEEGAGPDATGPNEIYLQRVCARLGC